MSLIQDALKKQEEWSSKQQGQEAGGSKPTPSGPGDPQPPTPGGERKQGPWRAMAFAGLLVLLLVGIAGALLAYALGSRPGKDSNGRKEARAPAEAVASAEAPLASRSGKAPPGRPEPRSAAGRIRATVQTTVQDAVTRGLPENTEGADPPTADAAVAQALQAADSEPSADDAETISEAEANTLQGEQSVREIPPREEKAVAETSGVASVQQAVPPDSVIDSAAEKAAARQEPWPALQVTGIIAGRSQKERAAIISGRIVGVGGTIDRVSVVAIDGGQVTLEWQGRRISLRVGGSTE